MSGDVRNVVIRAAHVRKAYGDLVAVDDVSLTMVRGEAAALIGPSGSGKSTLLSMMIGIETPDQGEIQIDEHPLTPKSAILMRRRMGYVIQDGGLFPHMTAHKNIELMAKEAGWPSRQRRQRLEELCSLTRFPEAALDHYPAELSGGQRQRVSLMRALMLDPEILLLDEPLGALDPMIRADLQDDLKAIFRRLAKTVVLVTHDLSEAAFLADTIVLMKQGRIVQAGQFSDFIEHPVDTFVEHFVHAQMRRPPVANAPTSVHPQGRT